MVATRPAAGEAEEGTAEVAAATVEEEVVAMLEEAGAAAKAIGEDSQGPRRAPRIPVSERSRKRLLSRQPACDPASFPFSCS